ncbi:hypothetical protein OSCI_3990032 [Kamptonema sp. PCC 6506]|nr:hypothetical protein OSCI_3990032 [Kamptonema sp. PCC 6506]
MLSRGNSCAIGIIKISIYIHPIYVANIFAFLSTRLTIIF